MEIFAEGFTLFAQWPVLVAMVVGTVLGMMDSFGALSDVQIKQLPTIADGISEAMLTTAAGLIVALPSYVAYDYFSNKAERFLADLERHGMSLVRFLATGEYKLFQEEFEDIRELKKGCASASPRFVP